MPKESGLLITTDPSGPVAETPTLQCCHCGGHFPVQPGSGKVRGFCRNCMGPVCGPGCAKCVPTEQMLENIEAGRPLDYRSTKISLADGG